MSLFRCEQCGVVENTALCGWVWEDDGAKGQRRKLICSLCNPRIGRWHNLFPRQDAEKAGYVPIAGTQYVEKRR